MEINLENKSISVYRETFCQTKRVQECMESVVPDVNDDIGKIVSVQTKTLLKSKDLTAHGAVVGGELSAAIIYISDGENRVNALRLSKQFTIEYEFDGAEADMQSVIRLSVLNSEARVLNPRKVSLTAEIAGELCCYSPESISTEYFLPDAGECRMHAKHENAVAAAVNAVSEKTFTVSEQYLFPEGKPKPAKLIWQAAEYSVGETQLIGEKLLVKGSVTVRVAYLSEEVCYPVITEFSSAFSQLVEMGCEKTDCCCVNIESTSEYYDIMDTIGGDKALDTEIHAVIQIVNRAGQEISYVDDVYSNRMPLECRRKTVQLQKSADVQTLLLNCDEHISISEDCADVLAVFACANQCTLYDGKATATVSLDVLYSSADGNLCSARRNISMESPCRSGSVRLLGRRMTECELRTEGSVLGAHIEVELISISFESTEIHPVELICAEEEAVYDTASLPTVTVVRCEKESLWELAKTYHSSPERILSVNGETVPTEGKVLLIPKEM